jgi:hypothetical protein
MNAGPLDLGKQSSACSFVGTSSRISVRARRELHQDLARNEWTSRWRLRGRMNAEGAKNEGYGDKSFAETHRCPPNAHGGFLLGRRNG